MDLPLIRDLGASIGALFCGVIAILNGKDKLNKNDFAKKEKEIDKELSEGQTQFALINNKLENMSMSFENFYEKNDRKNIRILEDITDLKGRIIKIEVKLNGNGSK